MSRVQEAIVDTGPPFPVTLSDSLLLYPFTLIPCKDFSPAMHNALCHSTASVPFSAACRPPFGFTLRSGADRVESQSEHHSHSPSGLLGHMEKSQSVFINHCRPAGPC